MSKVVKILLKNIIVISFSIIVIMTAVLSALVTRYFDLKEYNSKIQICETRLKKEISSRLKDVNIGSNGTSSVPKDVSKDIVVSVEIVKSESKNQSVGNNDSKKGNSKLAQNNDNKNKPKKTLTNSRKDVVKKKDVSKDPEEYTKAVDNTSVINIINNNVILSSDDENGIGNVIKEEALVENGENGEGNALVIDGDNKTDVKENSVDLQKNEQVKNNEKNESIVLSKLKSKESKEDVKFVNESTTMIDDVKNFNAEKEKNNPSVDNESKLKKESSEVRNTIILIDE